MQYHFTNLVFEGGGVKGIAYVGAMKELEERGIDINCIQRVGGTSAGAINATLFACGYDSSEMGEVLDKTNFNYFKDSSKSLIKNSRRIIKKFGWYRGNSFRDWMGDLIKAKTGSASTTFNELAKTGCPLLYLVVTNLSTQYSEILSWETTPDMEIRDAVRMSMSIPLFFTAVRHKRNPNEKDSIYVDGGVLMNFPVKIFDRCKYVAKEDLEKNTLSRSYYEEVNSSITEAVDYLTEERIFNHHIYNKETLGLRLDSKDEIQLFSTDNSPPITRKISNFRRYILSLMKSALNSQLNQHIHGDDWQRTIYVDTCGVKAVEFDLTPEQKVDLIESGAKGVRVYFDWYDKVADSEERSCNHPDYK